MIKINEVYTQCKPLHFFLIESKHRNSVTLYTCTLYSQPAPRTKYCVVSSNHVHEGYYTTINSNNSNITNSYDIIADLELETILMLRGS